MRKLEDEDFSKVGVHDELGEITLEELIIRYIDHVSTHVKQIERNKEIFKHLK